MWNQHLLYLLYEVWSGMYKEVFLMGGFAPIPPPLYFPWYPPLVLIQTLQRINLCEIFLWISSSLAKCLVFKTMFLIWIFVYILSSTFHDIHITVTDVFYSQSIVGIFILSIYYVLYIIYTIYSLAGKFKRLTPWHIVTLHSKLQTV